MAPSEPRSGASLVSRAVALVLALGVERVLALPEVQKQTEVGLKQGLLTLCVSRLPAVLPSLCRLKLGFPPRSLPIPVPGVPQPDPAPEYSRCPGLRRPRPAHIQRPLKFDLLSPQPLNNFKFWVQMSPVTLLQAVQSRMPYVVR